MEANAVWNTERCHACGQQVRHLRALRDIQQHEEITIPRGHSGNIGWAAEHPGTIITFDGGAREIQGQRVAAGAAIHWEHDQTGAWPPSSSGTAALPYHADSQVAEAYGALMALRLLAAITTPHSRVRICGDNLGVVRYCAGTGRATRPELHEILDQALGEAAARGTAITWEAVRRRHNTGADRAATTGCTFAAGRAVLGMTDLQTLMHVGASWDDPNFG